MVPSWLRELRIIIIIFEKLRLLHLVQDKIVLLHAETRVVGVLGHVRDTIVLLLEKVELNILLRLRPHVVVRFWRRLDHLSSLNLGLLSWVTSLQFIERKSWRVITTLKLNGSLVFHNLLEDLLLKLFLMGCTEIDLRVLVWFRALLLLGVLISGVRRFWNIV